MRTLFVWSTRSSGEQAAIYQQRVLLKGEEGLCNGR